MATIGLVLSAVVSPLMYPVTAAGNTLTKVSSGLVHRDPLTSAGGPDTSYWAFNGDAPLVGGQYAYNENTSGLYIGVASPAANIWAGFYAESPNSNLLLFHTVLTLLYSSLAHDAFNTGLYVQTYNGLINYVTCAGSVSSTSGYLWELVLATGNKSQATNYVTLWSQSYPTTDAKDLVQDCTIITNGSNVLRVYMNGVQVYSSTNAGLNMPQPFNAYLEVETTHGGRLLYGKYTDYYATLSDMITVQNLPSGGVVKLLADSTNNVIAQATAGSNGVATLALGQYHMPISASVQVYDSSGSNLLATTGTISIWGGDVYQLSTSTSSSSSSTSSSSSSTTTSTPSSSSVTILSVDQNNQPISGYRTVLFRNGSRIAAGHTPVTFSGLSTGQTYSVRVDRSSTCVFKRWQDTGSTSNSRVFTADGSQSFTAVYRC